jgi:hypothetical protein
MDGISWTDLDPDEQHVIAVLGAGISINICDPVALLTLRRIGLVTGSRLTVAGENLRKEALSHYQREATIRFIAERCVPKSI